MKAVGRYLIIKIDRELQLSKNILSSSGLIAAPQFEYMQYNLQYGKIVSVGEKVTNPDIRVGRQAIIHHTIESDDKYLLEVFPNGDQLRWLDSESQTYNYKLYGVIDEEDNIIPLEQFVFCYPEEPEEVYVEEFMFGTERLRFATEKVGNLYTVAAPTSKEKLFVRPVISHVAPTEKALCPGQQILAQDFTRYPITLLGQCYWIISREFIISINLEVK
jgi:hypothetical protein